LVLGLFSVQQPEEAADIKRSDLFYADKNCPGFILSLDVVSISLFEALHKLVMALTFAVRRRLQLSAANASSESGARAFKRECMHVSLCVRSTPPPSSIRMLRPFSTPLPLSIPPHFKHVRHPIPMQRPEIQRWLVLVGGRTKGACSRVRFAAGWRLLAGQFVCRWTEGGLASTKRRRIGRPAEPDMVEERSHSPEGGRQHRRETPQAKTTGSGALARTVRAAAPLRPRPLPAPRRR
jgi:hypothetical protein